MKYGIYYAYWEKEWGGQFVPYVEKLDIDWLTMKTQLENWMQQLCSS